jgi:hypothetical protein
MERQRDTPAIMTTAAAPGRRRFVWWTLGGLIVALALANVPVTTEQGVNFEVSTHRLPLYVKTFEFLDRDAQYRQLAHEITHAARSDEDRVLAVFNWTARRIQRAPEGWPVIDDHILNIIIRGYGTSDQRADVFATLATYAGVPAFWRVVKAPGTRDGVILTFVHLGRRWVVMDIANGFMFRNVRGELADADDFAAGRATLPAAAGSLMTGPTPYAQVFTQLRMPPIPGTLRAQLQMPWRRLWYQTQRAIGREREDGTNDGLER